VSTLSKGLLNHWVQMVECSNGTDDAARGVFKENETFAPKVYRRSTIVLGFGNSLHIIERRSFPDESIEHLLEIIAVYMRAGRLVATKGLYAGCCWYVVSMALF
jgi:hypothetical protein